MAATIVIASPHPRDDSLEQRVREQLPGYAVVRVRAREQLTLRALENVDPEFVFVPHWSWIIPDEIHTRFVCVIFHMTDLPYGRGGSPLQNLILRGHRDTTLTALKCVTEVDAGPIYMKRPLQLAGTAEEILTRAAGLMADMIVEMVQTHPSPVPQQGEVVTFSRRRPADGDLEPLAQLDRVFDYIRMLDGEGYPAAFIETEHLRVEFSRASLTPDAVVAQVRITKRQS